ncbi:hypothetical protein PFISCL1PPCAC_22597, partial [Pristionchus fissidentatus]
TIGAAVRWAHGMSRPLLIAAALLAAIHLVSSAGLCHRNICLNGGTCMVRDDDSFGCRCPTGYGGLICEVSCGCIHGDCDPDTRECHCNKGWIGERCDIEAPRPATPCSRDLDCPSDQRCLETDNSTLICMADPCHSNPCRHGGRCLVVKSEAQCSCPSSFKGKLCEEDVNECLESPCRNGGECINKLGAFECRCTGGFMGATCDIEGCSSLCGGGCVKHEGATGFACACANGTSANPGCIPLSDSACGDCLNGSKCVQITADKFMCLCEPAFTGPACERPAECLVNGAPCGNGGKCVRGLGVTFCQCPQGAFEGANCETAITTTSSSTTSSPPTPTVTVPTMTSSTTAQPRSDPCEHVRCANGGYCLLSNGDPKCACPASFTGTWCESPAGACSSSPCSNGGSCREMGDAEGSFECVCPRGFSGNLCEQVTEVFQSLPTPTPEELSEIPSSTSTPGPPMTTARPPPPATTQLVILPEAAPEVTCAQCVHSSRCVDTDEGSICVCEDGFVGTRCEKTTQSCSSHLCPSPLVCRRSATLTTSKLSCGCPQGFGGSDCSLVSAVSFSQQSLFVHQSPHVMIGSSSGPLPYEVSFSFRTTLREVHLVSGEDLFGTRLYSVFIEDGRLTLNISSTTYTVLATRVNDGEWYELALRKAGKDLLLSLSTSSRHLLTRPLPRPSSFDVFSTRLGKISSSSHFVGCIADFVIDGEYRDMAALPRGVALTRGCTHQSICATSPCGTGECVDQWDSFTCICPPPLLPPLCKDALPPSTFGHDSQISYAHFGINSGVASELKYHSSISFLLRTKQSEAVVMVLGERVEQGDDARDLATFMSLEIRNGTMHGRARVGRKSIVDVDSDTRVDDNEEHLVVLTREKSVLKISIDGVARGEAQLESRFDYPLFTDSLLVGTANGSAHGAFSTDNHFKGSLQDVRVNDLSAVLHPTPIEVKHVGTLQHSSGILEGLISDNLCASTPCVHGRCSLLFNDFTCSCERGFTGRTCDQKDHCVDNSCPAGASCYSHDDGFTCSGPAHFVEASFADFALATGQPTERLAFSIRTNAESGHILTIDDFSISLVEGRLRLGAAGAEPFQLKPRIADGQWRNISIHKNVARIDGQIYGIPRSFSLSLPGASSLRVGATPSLQSFWGCINGLSVESSTPLSFLPDQHPSNGWTAVRRHRIDSSGCQAVPQCGKADQCMNGGRCEDTWNRRVCHCPTGFTGDFCEKELNECATRHCGNGYCVDKIGEAQCVCHVGYTGAFCEIAVDPCESHDKCSNDGVCRRSNATAAAWNCLCLPGHHGATCALEGSAVCSPDSCRNGGRCAAGADGFSCECPEGYIGEQCEIPPSPCHSSPTPCGSHGICEKSTGVSGYKCSCLPGYTGSHCDALVSTCFVSSCSSHGDCEPVLNGTLCHCIAPFSGPSCSLRIGACSLVPCQNDGECVEETSGESSCRCREYYLGDQCEVAGSCLSSPCVHGVCRQRTPTAHTCQCEEGYRGEKCEEEIDMCESSPCANGASCASSKGKFTCTCAPGFDGPLCDHDVDECLSSPCSNGGRCIDRVADFECQCTENFTGRTCDDDVDECKIGGKCVNGACKNTRGSYECACTMGFLGGRCTLRNPCVPDANNRTSHMCVHGDCARPSVKSDGGREWVDSECSCHPPYSGPTCATKAEESRLSLSYVLGPVIAVLVVLALLGCALLIFVLKGKGALQGHYSPSQQEDMGRYPMGTMLKLPPEERLI